MDAIVSKVTLKAGNERYGIVAQDNTGGVISFCCKSELVPKKGDKINISYLHGRIDSVRFNGLRIL